MTWPAGDGVDRSTRRELHRVAAHVLARAEHAATGRFGLRVTPGGFGTISFGPDHERLRVDGGLLIRESAARSGTWSRALPIDGTNLEALAAFADVDVSVEFTVGRDTPALGDTGAPIRLDGAAAARIGAWYAVGAQALDRVVAVAPDFARPSAAQLWPEHLDVALDLAVDASAPTERRANLGASAGDAFHDGPYLYVGPWSADRPGDAAYWNAPFGAVLESEAVADHDDPVDAAVAFFRTGLDLLSGGP